MPESKTTDTNLSENADDTRSTGRQKIVMPLSEAARDSAPVAVAEVMAHLDAAAGALSELEKTGSGGRSDSLHKTENPDRTTTPESSAETNEKLSIEQYMAELLERSRSRSTSVDSEPPPVSSTQPSSLAKPEPTFEASPEPDETRARVQKRAPEGRDTLSDLRSLANLNARRALNAYSGQQLVFEMHNKLLVILVSLVVSFALIGIANSTRTIAYAASVVALITSVAWALRYCKMSRELKEFTACLDEAESAGDCEQETSSY